MKKLLTIICAFSLIMAFTLPAMADTDVDVDDTQAALTFQGQTNQAMDNGTIDNDGLDVDTGDIAVDNDNNTIGNTDNSNQGNNSGNDNTDVDVTTGDLLSGNTNNSNQGNNSGNDNTDVDVTTGDLLSGNTSRSGDETNVDVAFDDVNDLEGNEAAATMGGFAIAIDIEDIELNLASTNSMSAINQNSTFNPNEVKATNDGKKDGDSGVWAGFESYCHSVDADVFENIGVFGANFSAGNFNNQANLNSVNVTVQY